MKARVRNSLLLVLGLALCLCLGGLSWASTSAMSPEQSVSRMEDAVFSVRYAQEPMEARVARLEGIVFGQADAAMPMTKRLERLNKALSSTEMAPLNKMAKPAAQPQPTQGAVPAQSAQPAPDATDYPAVGEMEQRVFGQEYSKEPLDKRLTRLEAAVFKAPQQGAYVDRVDHLRMVLLGDRPAAQPQPAAYQPASTQVGSYTPAPGYPQSPSDWNAPANGQTAYIPPATYSQSYGMPNTGNGSAGAPTPDMMSAMSEVEKQVFGSTYPADNFNDRLNRAETQIFGQPSPDMSQEDRLQRVIAVASANGAPQTRTAKAKSTFKTMLPILIMLIPMFL